jgi:hypothetical protein
MAVYVGRELVAILFGDTLTHVRSASVNHTMDTVENTTASASVKTFSTTVKDWSGTIEVLHDNTTDLFDAEILPGSSGSADIRPEGTGSGNVKLSGDCIVTSVDFGIPYDGMVAVSIAIQGNGALTVGTQ